MLSSKEQQWIQQESDSDFFLRNWNLWKEKSNTCVYLCVFEEMHD